MDSTENKLRAQCPGENARKSKTIAATWEIRVAKMPQSANISATPPATAPRPVAFCSEMPLNADPIPITVGIHGAHANAMPQRNRFFFGSSTQTPQLRSRPIPTQWLFTRGEAPYLLPAFCAIRAFTSFLSSAAGKGLSNGKCSVPFETRKSLSSSLNESSTDEPSGKKLQ